MVTHWADRLLIATLMNPISSCKTIVKTYRLQIDGRQIKPLNKTLESFRKSVYLKILLEFLV